jgi:spoIIIJ-associated protein
MRDAKDSSERLATLVELLSGMGTFEIQASIRHVDAKPGSDEARLVIHFTGKDTSLLTADNGRVLDAIEDLASEILGLSEAERSAVRFDAGDFLAEQQMKLRRVAASAIGRVRFTGTPYVFPPMSSRDRRFLEHALIASGLYFETLGQQTRRWVVLYPKDIHSAMDGAVSRYPSDN